MIRYVSGSGEEDILADQTPDLTSLLDILFILLVFFILTAGAVFQSIELTLPSSVDEETELVNEPNQILLEVRTVGYALDSKQLSDFDAFRKAIIEAVQNMPDHEIIVAGDKNTSLEKLLKVITFLQSQGIQTANILMQKEASQ